MPIPQLPLGFRCAWSILGRHSQCRKPRLSHSASSARLTCLSARALACLPVLVALCLPAAAESERSPCSSSRGVVQDISLGETKTVHDWEGEYEGRRTFRLTLEEATGVRVFTSGDSTIVKGEIFSENNRDLVAEQTAMDGDVLRIDAFLQAGTYCIRARTNYRGSYDFNVVAATREFDDDGNTVLRARNVFVRSHRRTRVGGVIDGAGDVDYFRIKVDRVGQLSISSQSDIDLLGRLLVSDASGWKGVALDRDSGSQGNFALNAPAEPDAVYFLAVTLQKRRPGDPGEYGLVMSLDSTKSIDDDTMENARPIAVGSIISARIDPGNDQDYYSIDAEEGGVRIVSFSSYDDPWLSATLLDGDGNVVATAIGTGEGHDLFHSDLVGLHFLKVESHYDKVGDYELAVSRHPLPEDGSKSIADAVDLRVGSPVEALIDREVDGLDVFRVQASGRVRIESEGIWMRTQGTLTTSTGLIVAGGHESDQYSEILPIRPKLQAGAYYLHVTQYPYETLQSNLRYRVSIVPEAEEGAGDDGDLASPDSDPVEFGSRIAGTIWPVSDVDYYQLRFESRRCVRVFTEGDVDTMGDLLMGGVSVQTEVPSSAAWKPLVSDYDSGDGLNFEFGICLPEGSYFIRVRGNGRDHAEDEEQTGDYVLRIEEIQDDHGNSPGEASRLTLDMGAVRGRIEPALDVDYFWIPPGQANAGKLVVRTKGDLDTYVWIENREGSFLASDDDGGKRHNFRLEHEIGSQGFYVAVASGREGQVGDYVLVVEERDGSANN